MASYTYGFGSGYAFGEGLEIVRPGIPTNLTVIKQSDTTVTASWDAPIGGDVATVTYELQYYDGIQDTLGAISINVEAPANVGVIYSVRSVSADGTRSAWTEIVIYTNVVLVAPNAPTNFVASDDEVEQITFSWDNSTIGGPVPYYDLYRGDGVGMQANVTSPYVFTRAPSTADYYVRAVNSEGTANSNIDSGTSLDVPNLNAPVITLIGPATVEVLEGTYYNEQEATVFDVEDGDITASLVIGGAVDINIAGTYIVTYDATDSGGLNAIQVTRSVEVVYINQKPVISLIGRSAVEVVEGEVYTDQGVTASDTDDGDITANVVTVNPVDSNTIGTYTVTYNVTDSEGLDADEVTRSVEVTADLDVTAPVITLLGSTPISINVGETYTDAGVTALDDRDGDITANVITNNPVDINTEGIYTITYNVSDVAGNPATEVTRTVEMVVGDTITSNDASLFLAKTTFGANETDINSLVATGDYEGWIDTQVAETPSYHKEWMDTNFIGVGIPNLADDNQAWQTYRDPLLFGQRDTWWSIAINNNDQLRQRVAMALSEIMVVSNQGPLLTQPLTRVTYYDILVEHAFGNVADLLKAVTYSSAMGQYLSYAGNEKEDLVTGRHPDENYAREIMQLFTIGLFEMNLDGSYKLDVNLDPIPTYEQADIEEMAKVFTGLATNNSFFSPGDGAITYNFQNSPMVPYEQYHDVNEKIPLGVTIPAGGTIEQDIDAAIAILVNHDNAAPFMAKGLIQRFVTSNPSPEYVGRVSAAFVDNGSGVRGDMLAVVKAVLLDVEASDMTGDIDGKVREPLLATSNLLRGFYAQDELGTLTNGGTDIYQYDSFHFHGTGYTYQEGALEAETVFNYFQPDYAPYSLVLQDLTAPEMKVLNNGLLKQIMGIVCKDGFVYRTYNITAELDISAEVALYSAGNYTNLITRLDVILVAGRMRDATKTGINNYIATATGYTDEEMTRHIIGLVMVSPEYITQR